MASTLVDKNLVNLTRKQYRSILDAADRIDFVINYQGATSYTAVLQDGTPVGLIVSDSAKTDRKLIDTRMAELAAVA